MNMPESFEFKIKLRKKDIINYAVTHYFKRMKVYNVGLIIFMVLTSFFFLILALGREGDFVLPITIIAYPIIYFSSIAIIVFGTLHSFNRDSLSKLENTYKINNECITEESIKTNAKLEWCDIRRVLETKKMFLLYRSSNGAYIFPKDQLDKENVKKIRNLVTENIGKKKRKLLND